MSGPAHNRTVTSRRPATPHTGNKPRSGSKPRVGGAQPRAGARTRAAREDAAPSSAAGGAPRPKAKDTPKPKRIRHLRVNTGERSFSFSWRFLVGVLVAAVAFVLVAPTLNLYIQQMEKVRTLDEQVAAAQERNEQLQRQIELWDDPEYVQQQARERLGYVMPGQQPYVVVDPETVVGEEAEEEYQESQGYTLPQGPWYLEMVDSITVAGTTSAEDE